VLLEDLVTINGIAWYVPADHWRHKEDALWWVQWTPACYVVYFLNGCVLTFLYCHLQGNQNGGRLQFVVAFWPALAVGSAVQVAAAHCPKEKNRTCGLQLGRLTCAPISRTITFIPQYSLAVTHYLGSRNVCALFSNLLWDVYSMLNAVLCATDRQLACLTLTSCAS